MTYAFRMTLGFLWGNSWKESCSSESALAVQRPARNVTKRARLETFLICMIMKLLKALMMPIDRLNS